MSAGARLRRDRTVPYRLVAALATGIGLFLYLGQQVENRLTQTIISVAAAFAVWEVRRLWSFYRELWRTVVVRGARQRGQEVPLVAVSLLFCVLVLWGLASNLLDPAYGVSRYAYVPVVAGVVAGAVLLPAIFAAMSSAAEFLIPRKALRICVLTAVFVGFFAVQVRIGYAVRIPPGWDAQGVLDMARGLATGSVENLDTPYFRGFPNNITLTLILARYFDVVLLLGGTDLILAAVVLNCLVLTLGAVLTYLAARRIGNQAVALFTLLPSFVFLGLSPWIMVAYSDTLGLFFPILLFYLHLLQTHLSVPRRIPLWILMGVTAVVGYNIKPTTVFVLLAVAAVWVLAVATRRPTSQMLLVSVAGAVVVAGSYAGASYALTSVKNADDAVTFDLRTNDQAFPLTHYLKMGAQVKDGTYNPWWGSYNDPDVRETWSIPPEERFDRNLDAYRDRVAEMGTSGYVSFLSGKLVWILGDGSFFLWGEGTAAGEPFMAEDPLSRGIQSYYGFGATNYETLIGVWQAAWFVLLGLVALPLALRAPSLFTRPATILRVALLGLLMFLLLFEARSRYLYLYLPFFILLASLSASALFTVRRPGRLSAPGRARLQTAAEPEAAPSSAVAPTAPRLSATAGPWP